MAKQIPFVSCWAQIRLENSLLPEALFYAINPSQPALDFHRSISVRRSLNQRKHVFIIPDRMHYVVDKSVSLDHFNKMFCIWIEAGFWR